MLDRDSIAAAHGIAVLVAIGELPHGAPAADVRPADVGRDQRRLGRPLHHRIVDRLLGRMLEGRGVQHEEAGEVGALAQLRDAQLDGSGARLPVAIAIAVALD